MGTLLRTVTVLMVSVFAASAEAQTISGAGATFPYPIYAKWADAYKRETGAVINYQSIGSGGGIQQIRNKTVTFGASDMPLTFDELERDHMVQFPTVIGGVVPVVNVSGVKRGALVLSGKVLASIYRGIITRWNDVAIQVLNPGLALPSQQIVVVHRSDGSGTTFLFTDYLSKVSPEWKTGIGANTSVSWPVGVGARGNEGVANNVLQFKNSIGYVEYAYVKQNPQLVSARMVNRDGQVVAPSAESFGAAATGADWEGAPGFSVLLTNQRGDQSWPIAGATFIIMHKKPIDKVASRSAIKFFRWTYEHGSDMAKDLAYVPMPASIVTAIQRMWITQIHNQ